MNVNVDVAIHNLNSALTQLHHYYSGRLKLKINPNKSKVVIFSKDSNNDAVMYNDVEISTASCHKFLGVIIDNKLTFKQHIMYMSQASGLISCLTEPLARSLDGAIQLYD